MSDFAQLLDESKLFDEAWNFSEHGDVASANVDGLTHYLSHGDREGRSPGAGFDANWYTKRYGKFAESFGPCEHYLRIGQA